MVVSKRFSQNIYLGSSPVVPDPPPLLTTITGAKINGVTQGSSTLQALVNATSTGGTLELPVCRYQGACSVPRAMTITGQGPVAGPWGVGAAFATNLDMNGQIPVTDSSDWATFVPTVPGVVVQNMTICNENRHSGGPFAAIRDLEDLMGITLFNVEIHDCDDGLLIHASDCSLTQCYLHDNGDGSANGLTHEMYFSEFTTPDESKTKTITLDNCVVVCGNNEGHAFKSRENFNFITDSFLTGVGSGFGTIGSSVIDISDAGDLTVTNCTITTKGDQSANAVFLFWGAESLRNPGRTVTFDTCHFVADCTFDNHGQLIAWNAGATLNFINSTYASSGGRTTPVLNASAGWDTVNGSLTAA